MIEEGENETLAEVLDVQFVDVTLQPIGRKAQQQFDGVAVGKNRLVRKAPDYGQVLMEELVHEASNGM